MPSATQLGDLAALYGRSADFMIFGMETIPVALLKAKGPDQCVSLALMKVGFKNLLQALVRD